MLVGLAARGGHQPDLLRQRHHQRDRRHHRRPRRSSAARVAGARTAPAVGAVVTAALGTLVFVVAFSRARDPLFDLFGAGDTQESLVSAAKWVSRTESLRRRAARRAARLRLPDLGHGVGPSAAIPAAPALRWPGVPARRRRAGPAPAARRGDHPGRRPVAARPGRRAERGGRGGADLAGHLAGRQRHLGALRGRADRARSHSAARSARPTATTPETVEDQRQAAARRGPGSLTPDRGGVSRPAVAAPGPAFGDRPARRTRVRRRAGVRLLRGGVRLSRSRQQLVQLGHVVPLQLVVLGAVDGELGVRVTGRASRHDVGRRGRRRPRPRRAPSTCSAATAVTGTASASVTALEPSSPSPRPIAAGGQVDRDHRRDDGARSGRPGAGAARPGRPG